MTIRGLIEDLNRIVKTGQVDENAEVVLELNDHIYALHKCEVRKGSFYHTASGETNVTPRRLTLVPFT
jgi:hypothetical protein